PFESRTRATLRRAEFGFLGVIVLTTVQTPRFCGQPCMAGCFGLERCGTRGALINWLIVGIRQILLGQPAGSPDGNKYVTGPASRGKPRQAEFGERPRVRRPRYLHPRPADARLFANAIHSAETAASGVGSVSVAACAAAGPLILTSASWCV